MKWKDVKRAQIVRINGPTSGGLNVGDWIMKTDTGFVGINCQHPHLGSAYAHETWLEHSNFTVLYTLLPTDEPTT